MQKKLVSIIIIVLAFVISAYFSYNLFSKNAGNQAISPSSTTINGQPANTGNDYQALTFDQTQPKTQECPLNGVLYSNAEQAWWQKHRPLGVMIENHLDARPQSGISFADVTYEAVAEGGITRTLNVYYCQDAGIIGPVRSARTYFVDFISEYADFPLYAHVGGANTPGPADALGQIDDYGWSGYNDMNQFSIGYPTYWRDDTRLGREVATEHTMYSTTSKLWAVAQKRGLTNVDKKGDSWDTNFVKYSFKDAALASARPASQAIHIEFWNDPNYYVDWTYDKQSDLYLRKNGGKPHLDRNTNKQLTASNVIILYMTEKHADDGYEDNAHLLYGTKGQGKAQIFIDGKQIKGTWEKASRTDRTKILDASGNEIKFTRGKLWFEIVATDSTVTIN